MIRVLFLILVVMSSAAFAQTEEKPKAYLFDEFDEISQSAVKESTEKLREKLHKTAWDKKPDGAYIIFFCENEEKPTKDELLVRDALYNNCNDCMGFNPMIKFVRVGKSKNRKIQFWILPFGANPPEIPNEEPK